MNKTLLITLGTIALLVISLVGSYVSANNYGVREEKRIQANYDDMQNILGQYSLKVAEAAQIPDMYRDDVKEVFSEVMTSRYGEGGSKAAFQWLQEQNPNLDSSVYTKIQQIIEAGRNEFQNAQTKFIDIKRAYESSLGYVWRGLWLRIAGFPKIDLAAYKIISSDHALHTFEIGKDSGLTLRKEK